MYLRNPGDTIIDVYLSQYDSGQLVGNFYSSNATAYITVLPINTLINVSNFITNFSFDPVSLSATSNSPAPITFTSSDSFIAEIVENNNVVPPTYTFETFDEGRDVTIYASQPAVSWYSAVIVPFTLTISHVDNVNTFVNDIVYPYAPDVTKLNDYINSNGTIVNTTNNTIKHTVKYDFSISNVVRVKYVCYLGELELQQFTDP
jgi:hypothetical protein